MSNKWHFTTFFWQLVFYILSQCLHFFKFSTPDQNVKFLIHSILMKIRLSEMVLCNHSLPLIFFLSRGCRTRALTLSCIMFGHFRTLCMKGLSSDFKLTKQILWGGCPSYSMNSQRKSVLTHKPSAQIPKAFTNQHDTDGKTIKYLVINTLIKKK